MRILAASVVAAACLAWPAEAQKKPAGQPAPLATATAAPQEEAKRITREEAIKLVDAKKAVFVDVRAKESYDAGHIKGAMHIPEADIVKRMKELPKGKTIITYCA